MFIPDISSEVITTDVYADFLNAVNGEGLSGGDIAVSKTGITVQSEEGYEIVFFTPSQAMYEDMKEVNPSSVTAEMKNTVSPIIILYYCGRSVMFTGDATEETEEYFLDVIRTDSILRNKNTDVDILKVAHHGSRYSTTEEFLEVVKPEISVISSGGSYEHPHLDTLERLAGYSDKVLRTDMHGDICITLKPNGGEKAEIIINTGKEPSGNLAIKINGAGLIYMLYKQLCAINIQ